jgi:hypothetical protein
MFNLLTQAPILLKPDKPSMPNEMLVTFFAMWGLHAVVPRPDSRAGTATPSTVMRCGRSGGGRRMMPQAGPPNASAFYHIAYA